MRFRVHRSSTYADRTLDLSDRAGEYASQQRRSGRSVVPARLLFWAATASSAVLIGCERDSPVSPARELRRPQAQQQFAWPGPGLDLLNGDAATQIARARGGRRVRGGLDDMLRVEGDAPGFGGYFVDSMGKVVVLVKPVPNVPRDRARGLLHNLYAASGSPVVRAIMSSTNAAEIRDARFSLSELVEFEQAILTQSRSVPGFAGIGPLVERNVVEVGVVDESYKSAAQAALRSLGVPDAAVWVNVTGKFATTSTWVDMHNPMYGGLRIDLYDPKWDYRRGPPYNDSIAVNETLSHGYNVRLDNTPPPQKTVMLLSSHGPNSYMGVNGHTNLNVYQPFCPSYPTYGCFFPVATVTTNNPWSTACNGLGDYCLYGDAAAAELVPGMTALRGVGVSTTQGNDGNPGNQNIGGVYAIDAIVEPDMVPVQRQNVFKSGQITGTTAGTISNKHWTVVDSNMTWGNPAPPAVKPTRIVVFAEQVRIDSIGWGKGDSGAPVFVRVEITDTLPGGGAKHTRVCNEYCALGMQSVGRGTYSDTLKRCVQGKQCSIGVSTMANIAIQLVLGPITP